MNRTPTITKEAHLTVKNISTVALLRFAQYPFLALTLILIPRLMGPDTYGEYALLISIITVTASLIDFGAGAELFGRFVPEFQVSQQPGQVRKFATNLLAMRAGIGVATVLFLLAGLAILYGNRFPFIILLLICGIVMLREVSGVAYGLLYGLNRLGEHTSQLPMRRALSLVMLLIFYHFFGLVGAIASTLLVDIVLAALGFFWTRRYYRASEFKFDWRFLKPYLQFDLTFFLAYALLNVWQRSGNVLIEQLTGTTRQVALFDIPNQIYLTTVSLIFVGIDSIIPIFTSLLLAGREDKLKAWSSMILKYTAALCTLILWGFIFLGPYGIPLILGPGYTASYPNGVALLAGLFPMAVTQLGFVYSVSYKRPSRYLFALIISFALFLVVTIALVPLLGSLGAAIATLLSALASGSVLYLTYREQMKSSLAGSFAAIALWVIFVPFLFLNGSLALSIIAMLCSMALYVAALFALKIVNRSELQTVRHALRHASAAE